MTDTNGVADTENTAEESTDLDTVEETADSTETVEESEEIDWKAKAEKAEADYQAQKVRAEKAEKKAKEGSKVVTKETPGLSSKDMMALMNAKVHEDDIDDVVEYAKFKKIPVSEALKSTVVKASLTEKEELRNTSNATNSGKVRSGSSRASGDALLDKARKTGELPESDSDIKSMLDARYKR